MTQKKEYSVLFLNMPLGMSLETLEDAHKTFDANSRAREVARDYNPLDFKICKVSKGIFTDIKTGETVTPERGCFTKDAWAELLTEYANA